MKQVPVLRRPTLLEADRNNSSSLFARQQPDHDTFCFFMDNSHVALGAMPQWDMLCHRANERSPWGYVMIVSSRDAT